MVLRSLLSPALLGLGSGRLLRRHFGCFVLLALLRLCGLWASAAIVEVPAVPALAWILALGSVTLVFLVLLVDAISGRSGTGSAPGHHEDRRVPLPTMHFSPTLCALPTNRTLHVVNDPTTPRATRYFSLRHIIPMGHIHIYPLGQSSKFDPMNQWI